MIILNELNNSAVFVSSCVGSENPNFPNCVCDGILFKAGRSMAFMWEQRWTRLYWNAMRTNHPESETIGLRNEDRTF